MYKLYLFYQYERIKEELFQQAFLKLPPRRLECTLRYRREIDKKNSVLTYYMLCYALKRCFGITNFQIALGKYGKPYLLNYPNVYFNISHCERGCAVAVSTYPIGIDIQEVRPFSWEIAKRVCCDRELDVLKKCVDKDRLFIKMWVKKESYVKMKGEGLAYGLKRVDTTVKDGKVFVLGDTFCAVSIEDRYQ